MTFFLLEEYLKKFIINWQEELKASIPGVSSQTISENSEAVSKLNELMKEIQQLKVERVNIEKSLKEVFFNFLNLFY